VGRRASVGRGPGGGGRRLRRPLIRPEVSSEMRRRRCVVLPRRRRVCAGKERKRPVYLKALCFEVNRALRPTMPPRSSPHVVDIELVEGAPQRARPAAAPYRPAWTPCHPASTTPSC
jgi:hypothetical protein